MTRLTRWSFACVLLLAGLVRAEPPASLPPPEVPLPGPSPFPAAPEDGVAARVAKAEGGHGAEVPPSLLFTGDFFAWGPRRRGQDFAVVGTNPNWGVLGNIRTLEGDYDPGFRIGMGYRFPGEGYEVFGTYTYWHSAAKDAVQAAPGSQVFTTLTHPALVVRVDRAAANNNINLNVFDLEFAKRIEFSESASARLHAGTRFTNLDQSFTAVYTGGDVASSVVGRKLTFDGGGLRVGGQADFKLLEHVGVFFRGSGSLMTGRMRSGLTEVSNGLSIVNAHEKFNKVIPTIDLGLGVSYQMGIIKLSAGYEFNNWFGAVDSFDFVDDAHPAKMARRSTDLGFDGVFFRAEVAF